MFTALNTTSNRIESGWNQLKKVLGKRLRIDLCLESIFAYQSAVMRREFRILNTYANCLVLRGESDPFMRAAQAELSEYAACLVNDQWAAFSAHDVGTKDP